MDPKRIATVFDRRLFQVLTEREEKNSVAIASNDSFGSWTRTFTDPRLCAAIVDRLTFGGNIIENRHRLLSTCPHQSRPRRDDDQPGRPSGNTHPPRQAVISCLSLAYRWSLITEWQTESRFLPMQLAQT